MTPSPSRVRLLTPLLLPLSLSLILCACQTQTAATKPVVDVRTVQTDTGCTAFARITFSRLKDTAETITQIKAYDAARDAVCGKGE